MRSYKDRKRQKSIFNRSSEARPPPPPSFLNHWRASEASETLFSHVYGSSRYIYIYYIPPPLTVHFSMTRSVIYQPILHTLYYTLHTEHAYCLSYRFLNNVVITTVIEMVEMVEILDGRLGKRSVERVRYVINNLLHLVIVKYGDISLVLCILSLLVKYLVILHANPCNKSYICVYVCF